MELFKLFVISTFLFSFGCKSQVNTKNKTTTINKTLDTEKNLKTIYPRYITTDYVLGRFNYTKDTNFVKVPKTLSSKNIYIRKEVLYAFSKLCKAAQQDGIHYKIVSGTRNFAHQKRIWDYKWNNKFKKTPENKRALKILEYSSMPGTSRHHWGTDIDINNLENSYFSSGKGKKEYQWLINHASKYGFYQVYTSKENGRTGYNEEKWHWSYVPLAAIYLKFYNNNITNKNITGFQGSTYVTKINMLDQYVNGINPEILNYKL